MKIPNIVLAEPYRLFFPLGWLMGIMGVSYWLLVSTNLVSTYNTFYHGSIQIELFCSAFAVGFLLTALPKFLGTRTTTKYELLALTVTYLVLAGTTLSGALFAAQGSFILLIFLLVRFAVVRVRERKSMPPYSFLLVAFGLLEGVVGAFLINYPCSLFPMLGQKFLEQGMFLSLSLGIGSFLAPRLMGVVDTANAVVSLPGRGDTNLPWYSSPIVAVLLIGLIIFVSFLVETGWNREVGFFLRATATFFCLVRFNIFRLPRRESLSGLFAAVALWSIALGTLLAAFFPNHEIAALHLMYIGGFSFLILTIGAQVISSHGGIHRFWQINKIGAILAALALLTATLCRFTATIFGAYYFGLLGISALAFDIAMLFWGIGLLGYLGNTPQRSSAPIQNSNSAGTQS
jgi:uncharacterized protein involved in response to NO